MMIDGHPLSTARQSASRATLSRSFWLVSAAVIASAGFPVAAYAEGAVSLLGALPNAPLNTSGAAQDVSADGTVAVGRSATPDLLSNVAWRWTAAGGMVSLGFLPGDDNSEAVAVSGDGNVVVGDSLNNAFFQANAASQPYHAYRWTQATGMVDLGLLAGDTGSHANAVSYDGSVVVGNSGTLSSSHAWRWTPSGGLTTIASNAQTATGVSSDGSVVVGKAAYSPGYTRAYRWTAAGGLVNIGTLGGDPNSFINSSFATGVSGDGTTVIGNGNIGTHVEAWRWTNATGMVSLSAPGASNSSFDATASSDATGINADGTVVVFNVNCGVICTGAYRWQKDNSTNASGGTAMLIKDWLTAGGVNTTGWSFASVGGVNANGNVVVGGGTLNGLNQAYIARVGLAGIVTVTPPPNPTPTPTPTPTPSPSPTPTPTPVATTTGTNGVVGLSDLANSLAQNAQIVTRVGGLIGLTLDGAHHHTLMDEPTLAARGCLWGTVDGGALRRGGTGHAFAAEFGGCANAGSNVRLGVAIGISSLRQDQPFGGRTNLDGTYVLGEADWHLPGSPVTASVLGLYGRFRADLTRGYGTVGSTPSAGSTRIDVYSLRARLDWQNALRLGAVRFSPSIAYTATNSRADAYQETGGNAPASFSRHNHLQQEVRATLTAATDIGPSTLLRLNAEYVHRFDDSGGTIAVANVLGVTTVASTFAGGRLQQDWGRFGIDLDHKFGTHSVLSLSSHASTQGQDADLSAAVSYKILF